MHPLTVYDIAVREHERDTTQRLRAHVLAQRSRERELASATRSVRRPGSRSRRFRSARSAAA